MPYSTSYKEPSKLCKQCDRECPISEFRITKAPYRQSYCNQCLKAKYVSRKKQPLSDTDIARIDELYGSKSLKEIAIELGIDLGKIYRYRRKKIAETMPTIQSQPESQ